MEPIDVETLSQYIGKSIGVSNWKTITQEMINRYADVINDHQKIHLDDAYAQSWGFPKAIAHGYLVLSLIPELLMELLKSQGGALINYGIKDLTFKKPVVSGASVRLEAAILECKSLRGGITKVTFDLKIFSAEKESEPGVLAVIFQPIFLFIKK